MQNKLQALLRLKRKGKAAGGTMHRRYTKRLVTGIKMLKIILHMMQYTQTYTNTHSLRMDHTQP